MEENKKRMVETLIRGRNSTRKLQNLFLGKVKDDGSVSVDNLMMEMLGSFYGSLSLYSSCNSNSFSTSVPLSSPMANLASFSHRPPEVCNGKKPAPPPAPAIKKGRGCYKRRSMDPRTKVSDTIDDGYTWRKYGQKDILGSKFPRCYYRCTYKIDHGCKALKQVQKIEDEESNMFHITYFGDHTCPSPTSQTFSHPELVIDFKDFKNHYYSSSNPSTSKNIHFDPSFERKNGINVFDKVTSTNRLSPVAFGSNATFDNGGTSFAPKSSWDAEKMDLFENNDILNDILFDETMFSELFDGWNYSK
ncbi:hypothetical protein OSB04_026319 [Centaurea solstitialis]|uniref:WRKY domain-containing protein n=1 Tax=Centaurea solstitialis TaxID=347529 RepID=A0AA38SWR7_9ASTR|nr:hypothetical protein OSB04_026319 [Centaurea solstitialis]